MWVGMTEVVSCVLEISGDQRQFSESDHDGSNQERFMVSHSAHWHPMMGNAMHDARKNTMKTFDSRLHNNRSNNNKEEKDNIK